MAREFRVCILLGFGLSEPGCPRPPGPVRVSDGARRMVGGDAPRTADRVYGYVPRTSPGLLRRVGCTISIRRLVAEGRSGQLDLFLRCLGRSAAYRAARAINKDAGIVGRVLRLLDALALAHPQGAEMLAAVRAAAVGE